MPPLTTGRQPGRGGRVPVRHRPTGVRVPHGPLHARARRSALVAILVLVSLSACASRPTAPALPDRAGQRIVDLVCQAGPADCLEALCPAGEPCPLAVALTEDAVYQFVATYAPCEGCATEPLLIERGIGRCIEYRVSESAASWDVELWVSDRCSFRYGTPSAARVAVTVGRETMRVERVSPDPATLEDPLHCRQDIDCRCLSGSGLPFLGCSNAFYAPLHPMGQYACDRCVCPAGTCESTGGP